MLLNKLEFMIMNSPLRRLIQSKIELPRLRAMTSLQNPERVLEIGCGTGHGAKLIRKYFDAKHITGIDLDPKMIEIAQKYNIDSPYTFEVQGVERLSYSSNLFDVVFDFGVILHIQNWQDSLKEIYRVLKHGGSIILEDLSIETFTGPIGGVTRKVTDHPYSTMYTQSDFEKYLTKVGFAIARKNTFRNFGLLRYFAIVARKI